MTLKDKVCMITGTSRGIGKATAERFAESGAIVYACARREGVLNEWANSSSQSLEGCIVPIYFDVTDTAAAKRAVLDIKRAQGRLDVLVNNAAVEYNERIGMITRKHMEEMMQVNVLSVIEILQIAARVMMHQKQGSIVNIASIVGTYGNSGQMAYAATKGAVIALTKSAAKELAPFHIRVNAVAPGLTRTEMSEVADVAYLKKRLENIGFSRMAEPVEVANACMFLASEEAGYISGQVLGVDGCAVV